MTELYIHIPYCKKKCEYCRFCSIPSLGVPDEYVSALINEIESYPSLSIDTVYFGGGTPSLLTNYQMDKILSSIVKKHSLSFSEISLETNPDTFEIGKFKRFFDSGINRLSFGVQSLRDDTLLAVGRTHKAETALKAVEDASKIFDNINVDLMVGLPYQSKRDVIIAIDKISEFVKHVSVYSLMLEKGTPLCKKVESGVISVPDEDEQVDMYDLAVERLKEHGFSRYEISNFAKDGLECKHNSHVWQLKEYVGVGVSAHSFYNDIRYHNNNIIPIYIKTNGVRSRIYDEDDNLEDRKVEYIMLALRTSRGLMFDEYKEYFNVDFREEFAEELADPDVLSSCNVSENNITIKDGKLYVSNQIIFKIAKRYL